jgi:hypothetical protein
MNIKTLLTLSLLVASFNAQSEVTACPSGWTKSADGLTCVFEEKKTETPKQSSNNAKPVCISGFAYSSTSMKCEQNTIASQFTKYKDYGFTGGLRFGNNPVEQCPLGGYYSNDYCFFDTSAVTYNKGYNSPLPLHGSVIKVYDGYEPPGGTGWNDGSAYIFGDALYFNVNDPFSTINSIVMSADNNDIYRVDFSLDGYNWWTVADIDPGCCWGIFSTQVNISPTKTKFVRTYPISGDGMYSIAELKLMSYETSYCTNNGTLSYNGCSKYSYLATKP